MSRHADWPADRDTLGTRNSDRTRSLHRAHQDGRLDQQHPALDAAADQMAALVGRRIGRYLVLGPLGHGGMGLVVRARDTQLRRDVALKLLGSRALLSPSARSRFRREARAMARVDHPGVVKILDTVEDQDLLGFAMELIEGCSLADLLDDRRRALAQAGRDLAGGWSDADLPDARELLARRGVVVDEARWGGDLRNYFLRVGADVADALQAVHDADVLHRDVKPSNILLDRRGRPRLADFGVAADPQATAQTQGSLCGTAVYAAPELLRSDADIDGRTDVFGLGATLYECFALATPVSGSAVTALHQWQAGKAVPLARRVKHLPRDPLVVIGHALLFEPEGRYDDAASMAADLRSCVAGRAISVRPVPKLVQAWRWLRREPARYTAAAALTIAVVSLAVLAARYQDARSLERRQELVAQQAADRARLAKFVDHRLAASTFLMQFEGHLDQALTMAQDTYEAVQAEAPNEQPLVAIHLARCLANAGRIEEAREVLRDAPALRTRDGLRRLAGQLVDPQEMPREDLRQLAQASDEFEPHVVAGWLHRRDAIGGRFGHTRLHLANQEFTSAQDRASGAYQQLLEGERIACAILLERDASWKSMKESEQIPILRERLVDYVDRYADASEKPWAVRLRAASDARMVDPELSLAWLDHPSSASAPSTLVDRLRLRVMTSHNGLAATRDWFDRRLQELAGDPLAAAMLVFEWMICEGGVRVSDDPAGDPACLPTGTVESALATIESAVGTPSPGEGSRSNSALMLARIQMLLGMGRGDEALQESRRLSAREPHRSGAVSLHSRVAMASFHAKARNMRLAAQRAVHHGKDFDGWSTSDLQELAELETEVRELLERAAQDAPGVIGPAVRYATFLLTDLGRIEEALGWVDACIDIEPYMVANRQVKGTALRTLGRYDEAVEVLDKAVTMATSAGQDTPKLRYELAFALLMRQLHHRVEGRALDSESLEDTSLKIAGIFVGSVQGRLKGRDVEGAEGLRLLIEALSPHLDKAGVAAAVDKAWAARGGSAGNTFAFACAFAMELCGRPAQALSILRSARQTAAARLRIEPVEGQRECCERELRFIDAWQGLLQAQADAEFERLMQKK